MPFSFFSHALSFGCLMVCWPTYIYHAREANHTKRFGVASVGPQLAARLHKSQYGVAIMSGPSKLGPYSHSD